MHEAHLNQSVHQYHSERGKSKPLTLKQGQQPWSPRGARPPRTTVRHCTYVGPRGSTAGVDGGVALIVGGGLQVPPRLDLRQQLRVVSRRGHHVEGFVA